MRVMLVSLLPLRVLATSGHERLVVGMPHLSTSPTFTKLSLAPELGVAGAPTQSTPACRFAVSRRIRQEYPLVLLGSHVGIEQAPSHKVSRLPIVEAGSRRHHPIPLLSGQAGPSQLYGFRLRIGCWWFG